MSSPLNRSPNSATMAEEFDSLLTRVRIASIQAEYVVVPYILNSADC